MTRTLVLLNAVALFLGGALNSGNSSPGGQSASCEKFPGADFGAKVNACMAALPSAKGTADASGFGSGPILQSTTISVTRSGITLKLPPAVITHSVVAIAVNADRVTVEGAGDATHFRAADGLNANTINVATTAAVDDLKIHDLQLDGNAAGQRVNTFGIQSNTARKPLTNFEFYNLYLHDHKRVDGGNEIQLGVNGTGSGFIHHVRCLNHACVAVYGDDIIISNNVATHADDDGFAAIGGPGLTVNRIVFANNTVSGTTGGHGIDVVNGRNVIVTGNTITGTYLHGILLWDNALGAGNYTTDSTVTGNTVDLGGTGGKAKTGCGIVVQGQRVTLAANVVRRSRGSNICVTDNSANVAVAGNTAMNAAGADGIGAGILVANASEVQIVGNTSGDDRGSSATQRYGVYVGGSRSQHVYVRVNRFRNNVKGGHTFAAGREHFAAGNCVNDAC